MVLGRFATGGAFEPPALLVGADPPFPPLDFVMSISLVSLSEGSHVNDSSFWVEANFVRQNSRSTKIAGASFLSWRLNGLFQLLPKPRNRISHSCTVSWVSFGAV